MKTEEILKLVALLANKDKEETGHVFFKDAIGKWVIIRTYNEGLNFGKLKAANEFGCIIEDARRLHRPISKDHNEAWYEGVANSGLDEANGRISSAVREKYIIERYSITTCTPEAIKNIQNAVACKTDL